MNTEKTIEAARKGFEESFEEGKFYNRQTQDTEHLNQIIEALNIQDHNVILDIVEKTLQVNRDEAEKQNLKNICFVSYDGRDFPFEDKYFDIIVTRYALHHFPEIECTFEELARVIKQGGHLMIVDPTPNEDDVTRFVDAYMKMKPDGHMKYYTKDEFEALGKSVGFSLVNAFQTEITFPRLKDTDYGYETVIKTHDKDIVSGYRVHETRDGKYIYITQRVWNLSFVKV